jgi:hypothetical protein
VITDHARDIVECILGLPGQVLGVGLELIQTLLEVVPELTRVHLAEVDLEVQLVTRPAEPSDPKAQHLVVVAHESSFSCALTEHP